jgi:hypothetical protein
MQCKPYYFRLINSSSGNSALLEKKLNAQLNTQRSSNAEQKRKSTRKTGQDKKTLSPFLTLMVPFEDRY